MADRKTELSMPMEKASLYSMVIAVPIVVFLSAAYLWILGLEGVVSGLEFIVQSPIRFIVAGVIGVVIFVGGILAHEAIHGISWAVFGKKPLSSIEFGYQKETASPYAHCKEPLQARAYRLGAAMPGLVLGIVPSIIGVWTGNIGVLVFGLVFTGGAGGDALIIWLIRSVEPRTLVEDHPTRAGCYVIENI